MSYDLLFYVGLNTCRDFIEGFIEHHFIEVSDLSN